jgi:hypothetical protein
MNNLKSRISRVETAARPMIDRREQRIAAYIAECEGHGYPTTRKEAEQVLEMFTKEVEKLSHLPLPDRTLQARINVSIIYYRQETGATEDEAIAALKPFIPELCKA